MGKTKENQFEFFMSFFFILKCRTRRGDDELCTLFTHRIYSLIKHLECLVQAMNYDIVLIVLSLGNVALTY